MLAEADWGAAASFHRPAADRAGDLLRAVLHLCHGVRRRGLGRRQRGAGWEKEGKRSKRATHGHKQRALCVVSKHRSGDGGGGRSRALRIISSRAIAARGPACARGEVLVRRTLPRHRRHVSLILAGEAICAGPPPPAWSLG